MTIVSSAVFRMIFLTLATIALALLHRVLLVVLCALLAVCCVGIFVFATDRSESLFANFNAVIGHALYIFCDYLVRWVLLAEFVTLGTHIAGDVVDCRVDRIFVGILGQDLDDATHILAIVLARNAALWIGERSWRDHNILTCWQWIRAVDI